MSNKLEDSKLINFRHRVVNLQIWFTAGREIKNLVNQYYQLPFMPDWVENSDNEFISVISNELKLTQYTTKSGRTIMDYHRMISNTKDLLEGKYVDLYPKSIGELPSVSYLDEKNLSYNFYRLMYRKEIHQCEYEMIFWWLVILVLDTNLYRQYLNYLSDIADIFGFTEDMIKDWCEAVIYWLDGNDIDDKSKIEFLTTDANNFFKHKNT